MVWAAPADHTEKNNLSKVRPVRKGVAQPQPAGPVTSRKRSGYISKST